MVTKDDLQIGKVTPSPALVSEGSEEPKGLNLETKRTFRNQTMLKKLLTLTMAIALTVGAKAQYSQYGSLENFYEANPDLPNASRYTGRLVNPNYILVDWSRWSDMDERMTANGFSRLGISNWEDHDVYAGGVPQRELAVAYARAIGADVVLYSTTTESANPTYPTFHHYVGFYAKQRSEVRRAAPALEQSELERRADQFSGGEYSAMQDDLRIAESRLQAAWDRLPAWKRNQLRASERSWIAEKDAAMPERRLEMVNERSAWLLRQR